MSGNAIREISVFVDESGSFDANAKSSQFYVICMVFHDQQKPVADDIARLDASLSELGLTADHAVHAGPLVRWESPYRTMRRQDRRIVFSRMLSFLRKCDVSYRCFAADKRFIDSQPTLHDKLLQQIVAFLSSHATDFNAYDRLKIYYDNGQGDVLQILREAFAIFSSKTEFIAEVTPEKYRLFQVADLIATIELLRLKLEIDGRISRAEKDFFLSIQNLKKNYLKPLARKLYK